MSFDEILEQVIILISLNNYVLRHALFLKLINSVRLESCARLSPTGEDRIISDHQDTSTRWKDILCFGNSLLILNIFQALLKASVIVRLPR